MDEPYAGHRDCDRDFTRAVIGAAVSVPLALASTSTASAAAAGDVTYAFAVSGTSVTNTITNNAGTALLCTTSLAPAPNGVLPPIEDVLSAGQSLYQQDEIQPGETKQTVADVPAGTYVALANCGRYDTDPAMWVSDYPGVDTVLAQFPNPSFAVQQASPVVTVPGPSLPLPNSLSGG